MKSHQTRRGPRTGTRPATPRAARTSKALRTLVVGLTGPNASGKGEVAGFLASMGFAVHSLSDEVRREATRRGLEHSRDNLIRVGVEMRARHGPGALASRVLPRLGNRAVVDSIRNPGEVAVLRGVGHFLLLGIDAPQELRFKRSLLRGRLGDGATLGEFAAKEQRENSSTQAGQQLLATLALADVVIDNDGTIEELRRRVQDAIEKRGISLTDERSPAGP